MAELRKVLHVDDDEDIRVIARMSLEVVGDLKVHQCESGQQAIEQAEAAAPDLFLLDYMMPGMNGEETLSRLRRIPGLENVPVVFMTARVQPDVAAALKKNGAIDVIEKPFDPMDLCEKLRAAWARRLAQTASHAAAK